MLRAQYTAITSRIWLAAAILLAGCADRPTSSPNPPPRPAPVGDKADLFEMRGPNAYDVIKLSRFSDESGPVYFSHALHADLIDVEGKQIACVRCHHELKSPDVKAPRGCDKCHLQHRHAGESKVPAT